MRDSLWAGDFGTQYTIRNTKKPDRSAFWAEFYAKYPVRSVLEIGCGDGANLAHAKAEKIYGIDVNEKAVEAANQRRHVIALHSSIFDRLLFPKTFELVFSCGVLIHIAPNDFRKAVDEMVRISSKYVLALEYEAPFETKLYYRGQRNALWKRPYGRMISQFVGVSPLDGGFLGPDQGFDRVTWNLWRKE